MFEDDEWGRPENGSGEYARVETLAGHLLIVFPIGYIDHSPTRFTQPGKPSDVIVCDVIDLDAPDDTGAPGKVYRTAWWRSSKLIVGLRPLIGKKILGRVGKGLAQNGMNPPWVITDTSQEPGALDRARAWVKHIKISLYLHLHHRQQYPGLRHPWRQLVLVGAMNNSSNSSLLPDLVTRDPLASSMT